VLRLLYNAIWCLALPIALRLSATRGASDRRERLGRIDAPDKPASPAARIWLHAASVGEIEGVRAIAMGLKRELAESTLVVTTMTVAGRDAARRRIPVAAAYALAPLDAPWTVRRFLRKVQPNLVLIAETELWPNYFIEAHRVGAKIAIVNGRISARSLGRYQWAQPLFAEALGCADLILTQTEDDQRRYQWLGAPAERIVVTGNAKYDLEDQAAAGLPLRPELEAFATGKPLLVAGSTAAGEEQVVLEAYLSLLKRFPDLSLALAPRHLNRVPGVEALLQAAGLPYVNATSLKLGEGAAIPAVLILDTMGELRALYRRAAVAFVGGSIAPGRGGQNLAEPAAASVPVLFGPFHEAQKEIASALLAAGGGRVVNDSAQLAEVCGMLLADDGLRQATGRNACAALSRLAGGIEPTLMRLKALASLS
jgi:3-deoxy-D-manno-octulosonic-acid transferase